MADIGKDRFSEHEDEEGRKKKFTVVDKRFNLEEDVVEVAPPAAAPPPPAAPAPKVAKTIHIDPTPDAAPAAIVDEVEFEAEMEEAVEAASTGPEGDPLAIQNALLIFVEELYTRVLIFMGAMPHPTTGLTIRNLDQAQRGIQALDVLIKEAKRDAPPELQLGLDKLIQQLKMAYVQMVTGGPGMPAPGEIITGR